MRAVELVTGKDLNMEMKIDGLTDAEVTQARDEVARYTVSS